MKPTSSSSSNTWIWVAAMVLLVILAGGGFLLLRNGNLSPAGSLPTNAPSKASDAGSSSAGSGPKPLPVDDQSKQAP